MIVHWSGLLLVVTNVVRDGVSNAARQARLPTDLTLYCSTVSVHVPVGGIWKSLVHVYHRKGRSEVATEHARKGRSRS